MIAALSPQINSSRRAGRGLKLSATGHPNAKQTVSPVVFPGEVRSSSIAQVGQGSVRFGGVPTKTLWQQGKALPASVWKEYQKWLPKQKARLADEVESFFNKIRRAVAGFMMVLSASVPLPKWLYAKLSRDYFFSPRKVMGIKFKKNPELNKKIIAHSFQMKPKTENLHMLHSFYLPAQDGKPTFVFSHGRDTNLGHLDDLFKAADETGYGFFAYDYPGFGKSDGKPSEALLKESGMAACRFLAGDGYVGGYGIPYKDQILMGYSLGGGVAADVAKQFEVAVNQSGQRLFKQSDKPRGLVLVNTFTSIPELFEEKLKAQQKWKFIVKALDSKRINVDFNSKASLGHVKMPVRVFSCRNDHTIPPAQGENLANAAAGESKFYRFDGKGHSLKRDSLKGILEQLEQDPDSRHLLKPQGQKSIIG